ncbi:MAG: ribonuclease R [Rikenellaceae bacterium]
MRNKSKKVSFIQSQAELSSLIVEKFRAFADKSFTVTTLNTSIGGGVETKAMVKDIVYSLCDTGFIIKVPEGRYMLNSNELPSYQGTADMLPSGSIYIMVDELEKDIFVAPNFTANALNGDTVRAVVTHTRRNGTMEGQIVEIIERSKKKYVGVLELGRGFAFVKADSRKMPVDIFIPLKPEDDGKYENNHKVAVEIIEWKKGDKNPTGKIVDIFGAVGDNDAEMHAILAEYDLPYQFEKKVEAAADKISTRMTKKEIASRRDFRDIVTITIDPADAKDFDDALSIKKLDNGNWEVGVHIADVTHYVTPGSVLDVEAESRATSVYLVDRTVPMLPEKLSNGLCSLRPNEDKYCFSAVFELSDDAEVLSQWIGRTVICSNKRFAYADAQSIIETGEGEYKDEVLTLHRLAQIRRQMRFAKGAITFDREEAKFDLDEKGKPLGVYFKVQKEANQLIEEFMLLANRKVAEFIGKAAKGKKAAKTFVYRVHDKPNSDKLSKFSNFILKFGYYFKTNNDREISQQMNSLMADIKGKSEENLISTLAIRTMAKATYTTENIGHYGLAFPYYTHFTSPIRRYPDMMVHRLLALYMDEAKSQDKDTYEGLCEHSSEMEVRAAEAERASIKYKMVEFMLERIDQEFDGHISGVTEWGIYVELNETHIEGFISMRDLTGDYYAFNEDEYAIIGERTHQRFTLGDPIKIKMLRGDLARKQIDFTLAGQVEQVKEIPTFRESKKNKESRRKDKKSKTKDKKRSKKR